MKVAVTDNCFRIEGSRWDDEFVKSPWNLVYKLALSGTTSGNEAFDYIIRFASRVIKMISDCPEIEYARENIDCSLEESVLEDVVNSRPFCQGDEFITTAWLVNAQKEIIGIFKSEIAAYKGTAESYFTVNSSAFRTANRLFFHLVENKEDQKLPFAFLATYANEKARHTPLSSSLKEFKKDQDKLIALLSPLSRIAEKSSFIKKLIDSGEIMKPIAISADEALSFLKEIPVYEENGVFCRIPNFWKNRKKHGFAAGILVGKNKKSLVGLESMLDFEPQITLDGKKLTKAELSELLKEAEGLRFIKGQWVEVNHEQLNALISKTEEFGKNGQILLTDLLRKQMGLDSFGDSDPEIEYGDYLSSVRDALIHVKAAENDVPKAVNATLRPYQRSGYDYLIMMDKMRLGTCLADDMGLGKTLQVISLFADILEKDERAAILVVVPTSLVGNWQSEIKKFIPDVRYTLLTDSAAKSSGTDIESGIYITTYGLLGKLDNVMSHNWRLAVADEAQAIKNSSTAQSKAVRSIKADSRIAITGTPVENSAQDLWSLFDFINPGLLGSKTTFAKYLKEITGNEDFGKLRSTISPFILRRMKTDKSIISDLPDKIEKKEYPALSKLQIKLYDGVVKELEKSIREKTGIDKKGLVLSSIMKLKQICNHPDQYSGQSSGSYSEESSGKFMMLADICREIEIRQERVLVFTQFREIIGALDNLLYSVFNMRGLTLDGSTSAKKRTEIVKQFNDDKYCPYMILSLKAGGVGLNLTAANHVVHFDRWWNPAVENQATDRAFRIGQDKNVIVHSFITKGTIEEKIDKLLEEKRVISKSLLSSAGESWITELGDDQILDICRFGGNV